MYIVYPTGHGNKIVCNKIMIVCLENYRWCKQVANKQNAVGHIQKIIYTVCRDLCREPSGRPEDGLLRSRTGTCDIDRRRQIGRPDARPRTGCITRRTHF